MNTLLAALPEDVWEKWLPALEPVDLPLGTVLYEPGVELKYLYFPTTCIISLLYVMEDGASAEIAVVGNEGLLGISLFMGGKSTPSRAVVQSTVVGQEGMIGIQLILGGDRTPHRAVVQNAGSAYRLSARNLKKEISENSAVLPPLLRFTQALITQITQTAACNKHHVLTQQLSRWLLLSLDRLDHHRLVITPTLVANMLGLLPLGRVAEGTDELERAGVIGYDGETIVVFNRAGLEQRTCECYQIVKNEYLRLLPMSSLV